MGEEGGILQLTTVHNVVFDHVAGLPPLFFSLQFLILILYIIIPSVKSSAHQNTNILHTIFTR